MGKAQIEANAVTPSLFIGDVLSLDHVRCSTSGEALDVVNSGGTVLFPRTSRGWFLAHVVLRALGVSSDDASYRIKRAFGDGPDPDVEIPEAP
jgi:hypothetical protein